MGLITVPDPQSTASAGAYVYSCFSRQSVDITACSWGAVAVISVLGTGVIYIYMYRCFQLVEVNSPMKTRNCTTKYHKKFYAKSTFLLGKVR